MSNYSLRMKYLQDENFEFFDKKQRLQQFEGDRNTKKNFNNYRNKSLFKQSSSSLKILFCEDDLNNEIQAYYSTYLESHLNCIQPFQFPSQLLINFKPLFPLNDQECLKTWILQTIDAPTNYKKLSIFTKLFHNHSRALKILNMVLVTQSFASEELIDTFEDIVISGTIAPNISDSLYIVESLKSQTLSNYLNEKHKQYDQSKGTQQQDVVKANILNEFATIYPQLMKISKVLQAHKVIHNNITSNSIWINKQLQIKLGDFDTSNRSSQNRQNKIISITNNEQPPLFNKKTRVSYGDQKKTVVQHSKSIQLEIQVPSNLITSDQPTIKGYQQDANGFQSYKLITQNNERKKEDVQDKQTNQIQYEFLGDLWDLGTIVSEMFSILSDDEEQIIPFEIIQTKSMINPTSIFTILEHLLAELNQQLNQSPYQSIYNILRQQSEQQFKKYLNLVISLFRDPLIENQHLNLFQKNMINEINRMKQLNIQIIDHQPKRSVEQNQPIYDLMDIKVLIFNEEWKIRNKQLNQFQRASYLSKIPALSKLIQNQ